MALWLYVHSIRHGGILDWDGFERVSSGSQIWHDLRHGDWDHFWFHTNRLVTWPFLHAWVTGALFVLLGPALATARLISLFSFVCISYSILHVFRKSPHNPSILGAVTAWSLFACSPLVADNAANVMSEMPGLLLVIATLACLPDEERPSHRWGLSALFMTLLFYFKYNFSALTYAGLLIYRIAASRFSPKRFLCWPNFILLGIPLLLFSLWFLVDASYKWSHFIGFAVNNPRLYSPWGWESLSFYPKRIPQVYFAAPYLFWISVVLAAITAPWNPHLRLRNPFFACFLIHFAAALVHPMKMDRFQFIPMGLWFVITGSTVQWTASYLAQRFAWNPKQIAQWAIPIVLIPSVLYQADAYRRHRVPQEKPNFEPLQETLDRIDKTDRVALLIPYDYICAPSVFYYYTIKTDQLEFDRREAIHRWIHLFLFQSKESVLSLPEEERIEKLNDALDKYDCTKIVFIECTYPPYDVKYFNWAYGAAYEMGRIVASQSRFQLEFDREYPIHKARVRIYSILDDDISKTSPFSANGLN